MLGPARRASTSFDGEPAVTLSAGDLTGHRSCPRSGMLGASLRHRRRRVPRPSTAGLDGYAAGHTTGSPAAGPVGQPARRRRVPGRRAARSTCADAPRLHRDGNGLPIHGTLVGRPGWELVRVRHRCPLGGARGPPRRRRPPRPARVVPLPARADRSSTGSMPTGVDGRHHRCGPPVGGGCRCRSAGTPTSACPGVRRNALRVGCPACRHLELDERGIPTGVGHKRPAEAQPLGSRTFDDHYRPGPRPPAGAGGRRPQPPPAVRPELRLRPGVRAGRPELRGPRADDGAGRCARRAGPARTCRPADLHGPLLDHHRLTDQGSRPRTRGGR